LIVDLKTLSNQVNKSNRMIAAASGTIISNDIILEQIAAPRCESDKL
jgi:hypothetical protein